MLAPTRLAAFEGSAEPFGEIAKGRSRDAAPDQPVEHRAEETQGRAIAPRDDQQRSRRRNPRTNDPGKVGEQFRSALPKDLGFKMRASRIVAVALTIE